MESSAKHIIAMFIPILAICIPIVAIIGGVWLKMRRDKLLHETARHYAQLGLPLPAELLRPRDDGPSREWTPRRQLHIGAINVAVGLGLGTMFYVMQPDRWLWAIGCIPLFVGLALLLLWRMETACAAAPDAASRPSAD